MVVGIPTEITSNETRVAAIPATVKELVKKGFAVNIQAGAGFGSFISDDLNINKEAESVCPVYAIKIVKLKDGEM